jgi:glycosyltransferase involved in cell wall biosynthesis
VEYLLWEIFLKKVNNPFTYKFLSIATRRLKIFENQMIESVDGVMTLSENDSASFKQFTSPKKITSIPLGIDFSRFRNINFEKQYENPALLYHLGSMDWKPNIQGMMWFVTKVLPEVIANHPGLKICIAGKNMPSWFFQKKSKNLKVEGTVDDSVKYQEDKPILIVPLLTGSGIRVKILEAMAMGKTIISTSMGARGIPVENDVNILLADTPGEFIVQITRCLNSEEFTRKIGANARQFAMERFDLVKIGSEMIEFYDLLLKVN